MPVKPLVWVDRKDHKPPPCKVCGLTVVCPECKEVIRRVVQSVGAKAKQLELI